MRHSNHLLQIDSNVVDESLKSESNSIISNQIRAQRFEYPFRLLDDDGNIYFEGQSRTNFSFEPLDELGWQYGCTEIHYLENGKFKTL